MGEPPAFSGDANTWEDWSFKLRSCVSVVDLQLGIMVEEAELAAHANAWQPSVWVNHNMDAQLRYLIVMFTSGSAPQTNRKQPSASPPRPARSLAQLQEPHTHARRDGHELRAGEARRAHLRVPAHQTPPKFHEKTPREREEERKWRRGEGKKREILCLPPFCRPTLRGPTSSGFGPPTLRSSHPSGPHRL